MSKVYFLFTTVQYSTEVSNQCDVKHFIVKKNKDVLFQQFFHCILAITDEIKHFSSTKHGNIMSQVLN